MEIRISCKVICRYVSKELKEILQERNLLWVFLTSLLPVANLPGCLGGLPTYHFVELEGGLWCIVFDLVRWFPGVFIVVIALPFAEVLISIVLTFVNAVIEYEFEDVVASSRFVHVDVRGVGGFSLMFRIVVVVLEHVSGENGVSPLAAWEIEGAVAVFVNGCDPVRSSPYISEFLCKTPLVSPGLVHNEIPNIEDYLRIAPSLRVPCLCVPVHREGVMGNLVADAEMFEMLVDSVAP